MKNKSTPIWFLIAALLFAFIWGWQKYRHTAPPVNSLLLAGFRPADVTSIEVIPAGALEIDADRTNHGWQLTKPFNYPAQSAAIENLLAVLEKLTPATRLTADETSSHKNMDAEFGFDNPQFALVISAGDQQWQLRVGKKTAPGDQVFVRLVGSDGAFVTDVNWLQFLPAAAAAWRDTSLLSSAAVFNSIVITNGAKVIELRRDATNQFWRMTRPIAARADNERIVNALQQLRAAPAARFVSDDPKADLTTFGLQPADLDLWFGTGTNLPDAVHVGKATPENPAQVFVRREGWNSVVAVTNSIFAPWRGGVNDFRDPHLMELTAPVAEIEVHGDSHFTLQKTGADVWKIVGGNFPIDADSVREFIRLLAGSRIAEFVKDNNTATDLQNFGLAAEATNWITLRPVVGDTNDSIAQIIFGAIATNKVYVKLADENYVYALAKDDFTKIKLMENDWMFRDRRIWNFSETNVAQLTLQENGKKRTLIRNGPNSWSLAAGSQGVLDNPPAVEETVHRLGGLTTVGWLGRNLPAAEGNFKPDNLQITVELKTGEKFSLDFGMELPKANTALAEVTFNGDRWAFVFPAVAYQFVTTYLTIPPDSL